MKDVADARVSHKRTNTTAGRPVDPMARRATPIERRQAPYDLQIRALDNVLGICCVGRRVRSEARNPMFVTSKDGAYRGSVGTLVRPEELQVRPARLSPLRATVQRVFK